MSSVNISICLGACIKVGELIGDYVAFARKSVGALEISLMKMDRCGKGGPCLLGRH